MDTISYASKHTIWFDHNKLLSKGSPTGNISHGTNLGFTKAHYVIMLLNRYLVINFKCEGLFVFG